MGCVSGERAVRDWLAKQAREWRGDKAKVLSRLQYLEDVVGDLLAEKSGPVAQPSAICPPCWTPLPRAVSPLCWTPPSKGAWAALSGEREALDREEDREVLKRPLFLNHLVRQSSVGCHGVAGEDDEANMNAVKSSHFKADTCTHSSADKSSHDTSTHSKADVSTHSNADVSSHSKADASTHSKADTCTHSNADKSSHDTSTHSKADTRTHFNADQSTHTKADTSTHSKAKGNDNSGNGNEGANDNHLNNGKEGANDSLGHENGGKAYNNLNEGGFENDDNLEISISEFELKEALLVLEPLCISEQEAREIVACPLQSLRSDHDYAWAPGIATLWALCRRGAFNLLTRSVNLLTGDEFLDDRVASAKSAIDDAVRSGQTDLQKVIDEEQDMLASVLRGMIAEIGERYISRVRANERFQTECVEECGVQY